LEKDLKLQSALPDFSISNHATFKIHLLECRQDKGLEPQFDLSQF